jgi:hypothetical protein
LATSSVPGINFLEFFCEFHHHLWKILSLSSSHSGTLERVYPEDVSGEIGPARARSQRPGSAFN